MAQMLPRPTIGHNIPPDADRHQSVGGQTTTADEDDGLLAVAGPIMMLCYVGVFAIAASTFFGTGDALFVVSISIGFALMYFSVPLLMWRIRAARDARWNTSRANTTSSVVDVWTGPLRRWEAVVQIVSVPLAVLFGFASFAVIWNLTAL